MPIFIPITGIFVLISIGVSLLNRNRYSGYYSSSGAYNPSYSRDRLNLNKNNDDLDAAIISSNYSSYSGSSHNYSSSSGSYSGHSSSSSSSSYSSSSDWGGGGFDGGGASGGW